jgi:hypothetical protein
MHPVEGDVRYNRSVQVVLAEIGPDFEDKERMLDSSSYMTVRRSTMFVVWIDRRRRHVIQGKVG